MAAARPREDFMGRLTQEQWELIRVDFEVRGDNVSQLSRTYGVDRAAISRHAQKHGWIARKSHTLIEKKISAAKQLVEIEAESHALTALEKFTIAQVVQARLQSEGLLASFDAALAIKGIAFAQGVTSIDQWEVLTRGRKNLTPASQQSVSVNVNQTSQTAVLPPPSPRADETMRRALRGDFEGDSE